MLIGSANETVITAIISLSTMRKPTNKQKQTPSIIRDLKIEQLLHSSLI